MKKRHGNTQMLKLRGGQLALGVRSERRIIKDEFLQITNQLQAANELEGRFYHVQDLARDSDATDELIRLVENVVSPNSWETVGGAGLIDVFVPSHLLVVRQTRAAHDQIARFLAELREPGKHLIPSEAEQRITDCLVKPISLDLVETPLSDVVNYLRAYTGVNIVLDQQGLAEEGVNLDMAISIQAEKISLSNILELMLGRIGLAYLIKDDVLQITSSIQAGSELVNRLYVIQDLANDKKSAQRLTEVIESSIQPEYWSIKGGAGTIEFFSTHGCFVINQTSGIHKKVEALLAHLRSKNRNWIENASATRQKLFESRVKLPDQRHAPSVGLLLDELARQIQFEIRVQKELFGRPVDSLPTEDTTLGHALELLKLDVYLRGTPW